MIWTSIKNIETQVGQLASALNQRQNGSLPSDTKDPRQTEHCNAITLRSGTAYEGPKMIIQPEESTMADMEDEELEERRNFVTFGAEKPRKSQRSRDHQHGSHDHREEPRSRDPHSRSHDLRNLPRSPDLHQGLHDLGRREGHPEVENDEKGGPKFDPKKTNLDILPPPFPDRVRAKKSKSKFFKFLDILRQIHINIPFVDALKEMPSFARYMKQLLTHKKRLSEFEEVTLSENISAVAQSKLPPKLKDRGSFTIPCELGGGQTLNALADLGSSINLMPLSVFNTLGLGEACPTTVTLRMADRSYVRPEGKIEDVLVKVGKFIIPADFIIVDCAADPDVPIILGRGFLRTAHASFNVWLGELTLEVGGEILKIRRADQNGQHSYEEAFCLTEFVYPMDAKGGKYGDHDMEDNPTRFSCSSKVFHKQAKEPD